MQKAKEEKHWFVEEDLLKPIDWEFFNTLPTRVQNALELYMRGKISSWEFLRPFIYKEENLFNLYRNFAVASL